MKTQTPLSALIVDDEPSVRQIVRRILEPAGYDVTEAEDGATACAALKGMGHLDLLVSDFMMPSMTGAEVARLVRVAKPSVKVLFVTGFADCLFDERSALWEGEAFLEKPFNRQGLLEAVSQLLFGRTDHQLHNATPQLRYAADA